MNDKLSQTQKILRSSRFTTDDRGRTALTETVETLNLELMSTQMLQKVIEKNDTDTNASLRKIAEGESGLVARDIDKGKFEVISDKELENILNGSDAKTKSISSFVDEDVVETVDGEGDLDLVSTQMLRIALNLNDDEDASSEIPLEKGFDPYNRS